MHPINRDTKQMFILMYLRPIGEYQEVSVCVWCILYFYDVCIWSVDVRLCEKEWLSVPVREFRFMHV